MAERRSHRIRVICVNDVYSFSAVDGQGGWARAVSLMRRIRDETPKNGNTTVMTTVNGDIMGGSSLLQHSKGRLAIEIMNEIPIDACVVGNHEFDYGDDSLQDCISRSNFKWFGSNVVDETGSTLNGVLDYDIAALPCGLRIGLFGLCTCATPELSHPSESIVFADVETTARRVTDHMTREEGAHVVIALTHVHAGQDRALAASVPEIDLILGGHDHEPLALHHHHTLVFKCGQNGYWVGVVDLDVEFEVDDIDIGSVKQGSVRIFPSWHMHSTCRVQADPKIEMIVGRYRDQVDAEVVRSYGNELQGLQLDEAIATIQRGTLDTRTAEVRRRETTSGNLIADALLAHYTPGDMTEAAHGCKGGGVDDAPVLAMINGGFIRGDKRYHAGSELTLRDVLEEMPFPKSSCLIELPGKYLIQALEQQLRCCPAPSGGFPHVSANVRLAYEIGAGVNHIKTLSVNGREVDAERKYRVAITDFIASGGDGCSAWCFGVQQAVNGRPAKRVALIVLGYLQDQKELDLELEGRVTVTLQ